MELLQVRPALLSFFFPPLRPPRNDHRRQRWLELRPLAYESHMGKAAPPLRSRCPLLGFLCRMLPSLFEHDGPLGPPLEQAHRSLVQVDAEWPLASRHPSSTAVVPLPHRMGLVSVLRGFGFWAQKARPFLVSESDAKSGLAF